jgi:hypothetical protein
METCCVNTDEKNAVAIAQEAESRSNSQQLVRNQQEKKEYRTIHCQ